MLEAIDRFDHDAIAWVANHHNAFLDPLMRALSSFALFGWVIGAFGVWLLWRGGNRGRALVVAALLLVLITDQVAAHVIKPLVARPRPHGGSSFSFPSVHATNIMGQATLFARFYPKLTAVFVLVALCVASSRVYLEKHFPSDVVGGALLGLVCGWTMGTLALRWGERTVTWAKERLLRKKLRSDAA